MASEHERVLDRLEKLGSVQALLEAALVNDLSKRSVAVSALIKGLVLVCATQDLDAAQLNAWTCLGKAWKEAGLPLERLEEVRDLVIG